MFTHHVGIDVATSRRARVCVRSSDGLLCFDVDSSFESIQKLLADYPSSHVCLERCTQSITLCKLLIEHGVVVETIGPDDSRLKVENAQPVLERYARALSDLSYRLVGTPTGATWTRRLWTRARGSLTGWIGQLADQLANLGGTGSRSPICCAGPTCPRRWSCRQPCS